MLSLLAALLIGAFAVTPSIAQEAEMDPLFDFRAGSPVEAFVVNDGVMGGRSSSRLELADEGFAVFSGNVSLENNGGFASVRLPIPPRAMAGATHLVLRVRGDGQRYQARLRSGRQWDGVSWAAEFEASRSGWVTVEMPLDGFEPTFRGYRPRRAGPVAPAEVGQVGIMITDKQVGPFRLEIEWVGVRRERSPSAP